MFNPILYKRQNEAKKTNKEKTDTFREKNLLHVGD